jgi:perosamine synthetase
LERREFLISGVMAGATVRSAKAAALTSRPAVLGGKPVRNSKFISWPVFDHREETAILEVVRSGHWFRGNGEHVGRFEQAFSKLLGAPCLATNSGTSAMIVSLASLGVGAGDEVIVPTYTFIATVNAVLMVGAIPIFVDTDLETFQIDARKIEMAITERTVAILPVHLGGSVADMDAIGAIARKRKLAVVEDACQAHLAEWRGRKAGTLGSTGCFSFQASKNLTSGEGGALLTNDEELFERCYAFHSNGSGRKRQGQSFTYAGRGANMRMTEFQAAILLTQMERLLEQAKTRERNAQYLTGVLKEIPGILPARMYDGCTRNAYHLYMFRFNREAFGLPRNKFLKALSAEGIPASSGYTPLNKEAFIKETLASRCYQRAYSKELSTSWEERNRCPENDRLCQEAVWLTQNMLLGPRSDMDQIVEAIRKIHAHAPDIARA